MEKWKYVSHLIKDYILENRLSKGDKLPSDSKIAKKANVSLQPVLKAMKELSKAGIIFRRAGAPTLVDSDELIKEQGNLSFFESAKKVPNQTLMTKVLEVSHRSAQKGFYYKTERQAVKALGLKHGAQFYLVKRIRMIDQLPRVLHISFLNPSHFPATFLADHDFSHESLIKIFKQYGFNNLARETDLSADYPNEEEIKYLKIERIPILRSEQCIFAMDNKKKNRVIEYLSACYVNWKYHIKNLGS